MTDKKIIEVAKRYVHDLRGMSVDPARARLELDGPSEDTIKQHCLWMAEEVVALVAKGQREKAFRWLGFVQGALWSVGFYTIEDLKRHNMPEGEEFRA